MYLGTWVCAANISKHTVVFLSSSSIRGNVTTRGETVISVLDAGTLSDLNYFSLCTSSSSRKHRSYCKRDSLDIREVLDRKWRPPRVSLSLSLFLFLSHTSLHSPRSSKMYSAKNNFVGRFIAHEDKWRHVHSRGVLIINCRVESQRPIFRLILLFRSSLLDSLLFFSDITLFPTLFTSLCRYF